MFNLSSGELRLAKKLDKLPNPHDAVLYSIAAYQLATIDTPCPLDWLLKSLEGAVYDLTELNALLDELARDVELVRSRRGVATPHPRVAGVILKASFFGEDKQAETRRDILWRVLRDPSFPLLGARWIISELPDDIRFFFGLPADITAQLVERCISSSDIGGAGYVLAALVGLRHPEADIFEDLLTQHRAVLVRWLETCSREQSHGVARLLNEIINKDRTKAEELIDAVIPSTVSTRIQMTSPADGYPVGDLVGRLAFGSQEWKLSVSGSLDKKDLLERFRTCDQDDVGPASDIIKAVAGFDVDLAEELTDVIGKAITAAMRENPRDAFASAQDVLWWVLRFGPRFLMGDAEPEAKHIAIAKTIVDAVGIESLAKAFNNAKRRDWNGLDRLSAFIREASPEVAASLANQISIEPMQPMFV